MDVSTDCIEDFNKTDKSMELIDLMNVAINEHDVVFLCLIHENPKSDKARGHFGTELMNKASTVMQVSYEKSTESNDDDLIKVSYFKCRSTAIHEPFHAKYSESEKGLVLATENEITTIVNGRRKKANIDGICEHLQMYLGDGTKLVRRELLNKLCGDFVTAERTIEERLKEIVNTEKIILNSSGKQCYLKKEVKNKTAIYSLVLNEF